MNKCRWIKSVSSAYGTHYILDISNHNNMVIKLSPISDNMYKLVISNKVNDSKYKAVINAEDDDKAKIKAVNEFLDYLESNYYKDDILNITRKYLIESKIL